MTKQKITTKNKEKQSVRDTLYQRELSSIDNMYVFENKESRVQIKEILFV